MQAQPATSAVNAGTLLPLLPTAPPVGDDAAVLWWARNTLAQISPTTRRGDRRCARRRRDEHRSVSEPVGEPPGAGRVHRGDQPRPGPPDSMHSGTCRACGGFASNRSTARTRPCWSRNSRARLSHLRRSPRCTERPAACRSWSGSSFGQQQRPVSPRQDVIGAGNRRSRPIRRLGPCSKDVWDMSRSRHARRSG